MTQGSSNAASAVGACLILGEANILTVRQGRWYLTYVLCGDGCCCDFYLFNFSLEKCFLTSHYTLIFYSLCSTMTMFRYHVHIHLKFLNISYSRYLVQKFLWSTSYTQIAETQYSFRYDKCIHLKVKICGAHANVVVHTSKPTIWPYWLL